MVNLVRRFVSATFEERLSLVADATNRAMLQRHLGEEALAEYLALADQFDSRHLDGSRPPNLIFLPGVMGSSLASMGLGGTWWLDIASRHHIADLRLTPDGKVDADPRARVEPVSVMGMYEGFFAGVYTTGNLQHLAFAYDWRKPLRLSAESLRSTVLSAAEASGGPVHIVAHSMGGLLARTTLMLYPELWPHVGKVVFIGSPHYGSPAIAGYLKNHLWGFELLALLGRYLDRSALRSLRGVLSLLPAPADVYPGVAEGTAHPCANFDLYDVDAWRLGLGGTERAHLQSALDDAAQLHRELHSWHMSLDPDLRERMATVVGVGYKTLFRLAYHQGFGHQWRHMDRVTARQPGVADREGDGRVPVASAVLPGLGDVRYVRGEHGRLPTIPSVYSDVFRFLSGTAMRLPRSATEALDDRHLSEADASTTPALAGFGAEPTGEDPGYLGLAEPDGPELDDLDAALAEGRLPAFTRIRLL
ncbi:esterase/lipase family protein [Dactylosporangium matsuzakiense]|uniref:Lecithin:cholesterol acyltransferase n=1 Tax=Dactylosporangium matsuzakiense TaxID=53360 RepID=A0A9W6KPE8_9ACTN|nr:hypothetical protein [Dactylosporangium matsuzakiense]GLL05138.1 hypothetical protein GCM10017581_068850 [Dactylosporangium matsuzakiense]